jgi:hypothetical protein
MVNLNVQFLSVVDSDTKSSILKGIAEHYEITPVQAYDEVADPEAEHLLDYLVEPLRGATSLLMQRHGLRGW